LEQVKPHFDSIVGLRRDLHAAYTEVQENGTTIKLPKAWTTSGYDPRNPERIASAVAAYAPILPKPYRSLEALSNLMKDDPVKTTSKEEFDYPF
jgi:hypothetical protein